MTHNSMKKLYNIRKSFLSAPKPSPLTVYRVAFLTLLPPFITRTCLCVGGQKFTCPKHPSIPGCGSDALSDHLFSDMCCGAAGVELRALYSSHYEGQIR